MKVSSDEDVVGVSRAVFEECTLRVCKIEVSPWKHFAISRFGDV